MLGEAQVELSQVLIERSVETGLYAAQGATLTVNDALVRDIAGNPAGLFGHGVALDRGAVLGGARIRIEQTHGAGLFVHGDGTRFQLEGLEVSQTDVRECAGTTCAETPLGIGVGAYAGAVVELTESSITTSAMVGLQVADPGTVVTFRGVVADNPIGANVQVPDYDLSQIQTAVEYRNNDADLSLEMLPVAEARVRP